MISAKKIGWQPYQPHPGTRVVCCGCSLPGLAEFTEYQCGRTNKATIEKLPWKRGYSRLSTPILQTLIALFKAYRGLFAQVLILCQLFFSAPTLAEPFNHQLWDELLNKHVQWVVPAQESRVDYANFNQPALQGYLNTIASISQQQFSTWTEDQQLAFLINAYNAYTIDFILSAYPKLDSIKDLGSWFQSPWKKKRFLLFGEKVSLDHIEHELIRKHYNNPHIHVALVCAAISCPPLQNYAFSGTKLKEQLHLAFREFLRSDKNRYQAAQQKLFLSSIFNWYQEDFGESLNNYLSDYAADLSASPEQISNASISYLKYDWSLNDVASR